MSWCEGQRGFGTGFELDKDIIVRGNKLYSEDTCAFVPREINMLFNKRKALRGNSMIGVHFSKALKMYQSSICVEGRAKHLGFYDTEQEAFLVYKATKESIIKALANLYEQEIDSRVYAALLSYEVSNTD